MNRDRALPEAAEGSRFQNIEDGYIQDMTTVQDMTDDELAVPDRVVEYSRGNRREREHIAHLFPEERAIVITVRERDEADAWGVVLSALNGWEYLRGQSGPYPATGLDDLQLVGMLDYYKRTMTLQLSGAAEEAIWVGLDGHARALLTRPMVAALLPALLRFAAGEPLVPKVQAIKEV